MRTIDLLLLSQVDTFHLLLVGDGKHVFVGGVGLLHLPVEGRGCEHGFDGFERAAGSFRENEVDDTDPDEVQCGKQEVCATLW
jgi:hypothetical protein